jgi:hypothetical protein
LERHAQRNPSNHTIYHSVPRETNLVTDKDDFFEMRFSVFGPFGRARIESVLGAAGAEAPQPSSPEIEPF